MALEDDSGQPQYLQTVVGRGYRFVAATRVEGAATDASLATGEGFTLSAEELGRAIMAAAGLDPDDPKAPPKTGGD